MILPLQNGNLPSGFCPPDLQTMLNGFTAAQFVNLNISSGIVSQPTPPSDHTVAWQQLDSFGRPVRIYFFAQGAWLSMHPFQPGFTMIWNQVLPDFTVFDGGDASTPPFASISGQMWQLMSSTLNGLDLAGKKPGDPGYINPQVLQAQFPVGVGTFPIAPAGDGSSVAVGGTGGQQLHYLTPAEQGKLVTSIGTQPLGSGPKFAIEQFTMNGTTLINATPGPSTISLDSSASGHNTVPPFYGVYFLQRTSKLFYVV